MKTNGTSDERRCSSTIRAIRGRERDARRGRHARETRNAAGLTSRPRKWLVKVSSAAAFQGDGVTGYVRHLSSSGVTRDVHGSAEASEPIGASAADPSCVDRAIC